MSSGDPGKAEPATHYVVFLSVKPGKALNPAVIDQHAVHLAELDRQGKLVLAGPLLSHFSGMIVLKVGSLDEAKAIMEVDRMITGGFESYELAEWAVASKQNNYRPAVRKS